MDGEKDKFAPGNKQKENSLGKIIATLIVAGITLFLCVSLFCKFGKLLIPTLVILAGGFLLLTIWMKGLYIYRYLYPAIIIIGVFTVYPIFYTIFIAFTNYGTGHLLVKESAKEVLNSKWFVYENDAPLYAEFFIPEQYITTLNEKWKGEYDKYQRQLENAKNESQEILIENNWEEKEVSVVNDSLQGLKLSEVVALFFETEKIEVGADYLPLLSNEIVDIVDEDTSNDVVSEEEAVYDDIVYPKVYQAKYFKEGPDEGFRLEPVAFDTLSEITKGMHLVSDPVRVNPEEEEEDDDDESYLVAMNDVTVLKSALEKLPFMLYDEANNVEKKFLNNRTNEFMRKEKQFTVKDDGNIYMLTDLGNGKFGYEARVWEENKNGLFVLTKDGNAPTFWKEYDLSKLEYTYSMFKLSSDAKVEEFLKENFSKYKLSEDYVPSFVNIEGKKKSEVSNGDLAAVRKEIKDVNERIKEFNHEIPAMKKKFIELKKNETIEENKKAEDEMGAKRIEIASLKQEIREKKKQSLKTAEHPSLIIEQIKENDKQIKILNDDIRRLKIDHKGRLVQLKSVDFPKLKKVKLSLEENSNIDFSEDKKIEPGYMVTIGVRNFTKIFTTRNITSPFLRVFIWTVLWSLFSVLTSFAAGLALALVLNAGDLKGRYFYRTLFILPYAIPSFVTILMWGGFLNKDFGIINLATGFTIPWLSDPNGILPKISCVIVNLWLSFPYQMIISLGALQSIDASMYEAADVDGASKPQQFWRITLPLLLATLGPMLVGSFAFAFNNFGGIYLLTGGGPVMAAGVLPGQTDILISYTYKLAFGSNETDYGLASAIGIIVFFIIGTITFLQFKYTGAFKEVDNA